MIMLSCMNKITFHIRIIDITYLIIFISILFSFSRLGYNFSPPYIVSIVLVVFYSQFGLYIIELLKANEQCLLHRNASSWTRTPRFYASVRGILSILIIAEIQIFRSLLITGISLIFLIIISIMYISFLAPNTYYRRDVVKLCVNVFLLLCNFVIICLFVMSLGLL
jgi:hypothetical protein